MALSTILALTGNIQTALPGHTQNAFAWLEAFGPPLLVLATAYVLKEQILSTIETRHANETNYQETLADWQASTANPEGHPQWQQFYANALRDALRKTNNRRKETLDQMTQADWRMAVAQEMRADSWYEPSEQDQMQTVTQVPNMNAISASKNGNFPKVTVDVVSGDV